MALRVPTWVLAVLAVLALGIAVVHELGPKSADYCAAANLRSCKIAQQGTFVILTTTDHTYIVLLQGSKILSIQQLQ